MTDPEPELVVRALRRARELGFTMSSEPGVGQVPAVLAAAAPAGGRVIERGTGSGAGPEWMLPGPGARTAVNVNAAVRDARVADGTRCAVEPACSGGVILVTKRAA